MGIPWGPMGTPWGPMSTPWGPMGTPWSPMGTPWVPMGTHGAPWGPTLHVRCGCRMPDAPGIGSLVHCRDVPNPDRTGIFIIFLARTGSTRTGFKQWQTRTG